MNQSLDGFDRIKPGMTLERVVPVDESLTTSRTGAPVLSTPMMILLMEQVSAELADSLLPENFTTVGYEVCIKHKAPARLGARLTARSTVLEADGRKILFEVNVTEGDKVIGTGTHRRTAIALTR